MTIISRMSERFDRPQRYAVPGRNPAKPHPVRLGRWARLIAFGNALLDAIAPLGYEDETGFHYGLPPLQKSLFH